MLLYAGVAGYVLLFAVVGGLLRIEFEMPTVLSVGFASLCVLFGVIVALAVYAVGAVPLAEIVTFTAVTLLVLVGLIGLVQDAGSPA